MSLPVKIGIWGGPGGQPKDVSRSPRRLATIIVRSDGERISSISFLYADVNGDLHSEGPWGGYAGELKPPIVLANSEYVNDISGTIGPWGDVPAVITSLKFVTNKGQEYTFGNVTGDGETFHIPIVEGQISGYFGRAGDLLDAIGIYIHT